MKGVTMITALYDLHREDRGFDSYLPWFEDTLSSIPAPFVVFCRDRRVADAAWRARYSQGLENITAVVLEEDYPLAGLVERVQPMLLNRSLTSKDWHPEWFNKDYILLQFSKFRLIVVCT